MLGYVYGHKPGTAFTQNASTYGLTQALFENHLQDLAWLGSSPEIKTSGSKWPRQLGICSGNCFLDGWPTSLGVNGCVRDHQLLCLDPF